MDKRILAYKFWAVLTVVLTVSLYCAEVLAYNGYGCPRRGRQGCYWRNGCWWWNDQRAADVKAGTIVESLPPNCQVVQAGNNHYFYDGAHYFQRHDYGYVVVENPTEAVPSAPAPVVAQSTVAAGDKVTVNIPDSKGSHIPVTLTKYKNGYKGPQGEYYEGHPTVDQLTALYGK